MSFALEVVLYILGFIVISIVATWGCAKNSTNYNKVYEANDEWILPFALLWPVTVSGVIFFGILLGIVHAPLYFLSKIATKKKQEVKDKAKMWEILKR